MIPTIPRFTRCAVLILGLGLSAIIPPAHAAPLGDFDDHADVGHPQLAGSAAYLPNAQAYHLSAAGVNLWGTRDEFHFHWKRLKGDFLLQARVEFVGQGVDPHRKLGWMVRTSLDEQAAYADACVHGDGLASLQFRTSHGGPTREVKSSASAPDFIQFERRGGTYRFSAARFGEPLVHCETNLALGDEVFVGLFLCAHRSNVVERAHFRDVRIIRPAAPEFVPYRDYLGSHLEVLDVQTGHRQRLLSSAHPFEAPNWTPDGAALIYNTSGRDPEHRGRLHRFDLASGLSKPIPTGFAIRNNNDHALSFDGRHLAISHHDTNQGGRSTIFTVPVEGGTPRRITPLSPSYLHGWSPDAKWLVYTGQRGNDFDIYRIPADGGDEIRLTDTPGLDDGPEYSPDGKFIYFNSVRSGTMQIWRMRPDGSGQEQMTHDAGQNWFPHVSPDGRWIAFLTFPAEVSPADHPYYRQVTIRLMPADGGAPRIIAYVYGGQGTLNVPSWAPDSRHLAFVSNSGF